MRMQTTSSTGSPGCSTVSGVVLLAAAVLGGCAHTAAQRPSVAVAVVETMGVDGRQGAALQRAMRRELVRHGGVRFVRGKQAELVVSMTLAGLGEVRLVRTRLVRSGDGMVLKDLQETVRHEPRANDRRGAGGLSRYARELADRLFPRRAPAPWYRTWWVWTAAAAGVVGGTVGVVFAATRRDEPDSGVVRLGDL